MTNFRQLREKFYEYIQSRKGLNEIMINPSVYEIIKANNNIQYGLATIRFMVDDKENLFCWDGWDSTHEMALNKSYENHMVLFGMFTVDVKSRAIYGINALSTSPSQNTYSAGSMDKFLGLMKSNHIPVSDEALHTYVEQG